MSRLIFTDLTDAGSNTDVGAGQLYLRGDKLCFKRAGNQETTVIEMSGGKVGIGTTTPAQQLVITGIFSSTRDSSDFQFYGTDGYGGQDGVISTPGAVTIHTGDPRTNRLHIKSDGSIGIGTWGPQAKLHVGGINSSTPQNHLFGLSTGSISVSSVPIAKAWGVFDSSGTFTQRQTYNVSSMEDTGATGRTKINFATPMSSWDYVVVLGGSRSGSSASSSGSPQFYDPNPGYFYIATANYNGNYVDMEIMTFAVLQH